MDQLDHKERIANKAHSCSYCGGQIEIGEKYEWQKNVSDGEIYHWKGHIICHKLASYYDLFDDEGCDSGRFCDTIFDAYTDEFPDDEKDLSTIEKIKILADMNGVVE